MSFPYRFDQNGKWSTVLGAIGAVCFFILVALASMEAAGAQIPIEYGIALGILGTVFLIASMIAEHIEGVARDRNQRR